MWWFFHKDLLSDNSRTVVVFPTGRKNTLMRADSLVNRTPLPVLKKSIWDKHLPWLRYRATLDLEHMRIPLF